MANLIHFVYTPTTGSRVFAHRDCAEVAVYTHRNKSLHVGGGVLLEYATACPGQWWRDDAKALATALVYAVGGIAWDEQGEVHLVVPRSRAWDATLA